MSGGELERIAELAFKMSINYNTGAYHKPVALVWALDRARRGLPRLVTADAARQNLDELLDSITGSTNNASWPWLKLANDLEDLWTVQGADPAGDPPREFVAGWSRAAFTALADNPSEIERLIREVMEAFLDEETKEAVGDGLQLPARSFTENDVVVVAAKVAYDEYLRYSAYICQPGRTFRNVDRFGFYRSKRIEPLVPRVLIRRENVTWDESVAARFRESADPDDRAVGALMTRVIEDKTERTIGNEYQIFVLSPPDSEETIQLGEPIPHNAPSAWVQGQRYASSFELETATSTDDLS